MENRNKQIKPPFISLATCITWITLLSLFLPATSFSQSILFKSEKDGHTLYMMGSIHLLKKSHYPLAPAMEAAYTASDVVAFEIDIAQSESVASQQLFLRKGMFPNGQTLQSSLSAETYDDLTQYLATIQLSPNLFSRMKPPLCAMTITIMEMQRLGFDSKYGLDKYFSEKAKADGKKLDAMETIEYQIGLFFNQSKIEQELFLKQTLSEMAILEGMMQRMDKAWLTGDTVALHTLMTESFTEYPEFHDTLLLQRNHNWIEKIKQLHQQNQTTLIVVGAAHLVGKGSVIELLGEEDYSFEQL